MSHRGAYICKPNEVLRQAEIIPYKQISFFDLYT